MVTIKTSQPDGLMRGTSRTNFATYQAAAICLDARSHSSAGTVRALVDEPVSTHADFGGVRAALMKLLDGVCGDAARLRAASGDRRRGVGAGPPMHEDGGDMPHGGEGEYKEMAGGGGRWGCDEAVRVCKRACQGFADSLRALPEAVAGDLEGLLEELVGEWHA